MNAVYHRGYDVREPVEVRIKHDELVVLSYPGPDRSVRLDQLRVGRAQPRRYRNRRIGEFLKELELTEGRSTGIPKIIHAMKQNGSPPAEFEFDEDYSYFMVRLPIHPTALEVDESLARDEGSATGGKGRRGRWQNNLKSQVAPQDTPQVTPQVMRLLSVLHGTMDRSDMKSPLTQGRHASQT